MFDFIDHVSVLTLREKDHTTITERVKSSFGERYTLFEVHGEPKSANGGEIGSSLWDILCHKAVDATALDITKNHLSMIQEAYSKGYENVLFLEDDAVFETISAEKEKRFSDWVTRNKQKWHILFLGYCTWPLPLSFLVSRDVVRVYTPLTAHAYILNRHGMEKILMFCSKQSNTQHHFDKILCMIPGFRKYAIFPMMCFQENDPALYTKALDHIGINISFAKLSRLIEFFSVLLPFILFAILILCLCRFYF